MKLYILRHGHAPSLGEAGVAKDAERPISEQGRKDVAQTAQQLSKKGASPELILTSPLKRAIQTAETAARTLKPKAGVKVFVPLANQIPGDHLFEQLWREANSISELLIVGHQPQLGELVNHLTGSIVEIRPAGLVALQVENDGRASLLWSRNPSASDKS